MRSSLHTVKPSTSGIIISRTATSKLCSFSLNFSSATAPFSACSTINSAQDGTLYYNSNSFNATLTSTGYGKNSNLLKNYSEGEFQNIFSEDETFFKFKTNTTDSTGSSTNSVTIKIDFPQKKYVKSLKTFFQTNSVTNPSFSIKTFILDESKNITSSFSQNEQEIDISSEINAIEISLSLNKYTSSQKNSYYLSIIKLIPIF